MYPLPRCVAVGNHTQGVGVIGPNERGFITNIGCAFDMELKDVPCIACGQCIVNCPTGALREKDDTQKVWDALADTSKHVVIAPAPSVRAALGEEFGMPIGTNVKVKMVASNAQIGFKRRCLCDVAATSR